MPARRSSLAAATLLFALAAAPLGAHRRDEFLQAARVEIDAARITIDLDLTPGMAIADSVIGEIDVNSNGRFDPTEASAYAERTAAIVTVEVDGTPLPLKVVGNRFPSVPTVRQGDGTIRVSLSAPLPDLAPDAHRIVYLNSTRHPAAVFLANALLPEGNRVIITSQQRDVDQRSLIVDFNLRPGPDGRQALVLVPLTLVLAAACFVAARRFRPA